MTPGRAAYLRLERKGSALGPCAMCGGGMACHRAWDSMAAALARLAAHAEQARRLGAEGHGCSGGNVWTVA